MKKFYLSLIIPMFLLMSLCSAQRTIINSEDWRDVYSAMLYSNLQGETADFLVSDKHATLILNAIPKTESIKAFSSKKNPFIIGYESILENRGYSAEEFVYDSFNLQLAGLLDVSNFIIVDDSYGYNAVSVAPYAIASESFVLFADRTNIGQVDDFLSGIVVNNLIIYGHVDREVKDTLQKYNPEIINIDGDRFLNNIEIVKKYQEIKHSKQAVLTNGEFIEKEIMSGVEPVLFIGTNNVPDTIKEYIQGSEIDIGILIGNELVGTATSIRRDVGISVFVKFAQGARDPKGAISQVEALDMFYLPTYILNIEVDSIKYNKATSMLEVSVKNTEDQAVYFKGTYSLTDSSGFKQTIGDISPIFLDGNELKTITYDVEPMAEGKITGDVYIIYGESKGSMEKVLDTSFEIETVEILDECDIKINNLIYDKRGKSFYVEIENIADITCYADVELVDVLLDGELKNLGSEDIVEINPGKKVKSRIRADLDEVDIEDNEIIKGKVHYGQRENALINIKEFQFELVLKGFDYWTFTLILVIIALLILIYLKRRKNKQKRSS
ncbi:hypothetical protein AUJ83_03890 [Candidatus Woesearchaeota archaeon CG1_02_33_12]|nr:MAG: hypothetical protein AUJ83_03890 [Candidatus Woesearchaeota archaeon CG1_02_33_12]PIN79170.1 MAG: hypothetical protein COV14_00635 [Candidatus Woesearchaeota archaeon CG10_big_fil_rev_8_21_14_0_10_33_12]PIU72249.1 MAG: hypothetical protein COS79_03890 [Candidatus Woesearchaeota archaeon CG06_land_8_20_14_3_00_33_13]